MNKRMIRSITVPCTDGNKIDAVVNQVLDANPNISHVFGVTTFMSVMKANTLSMVGQPDQIGVLNVMLIVELNGNVQAVPS